MTGNYKNLDRELLSLFVCSLRKARGLSHGKMAEKLHISNRAYSDLESGKYCFLQYPYCSLYLCSKSGKWLYPEAAEHYATTPERDKRVSMKF